MAWPTDFTNLEFSGPGLPPYASRGLSQTLSWIGQASQNMRDINGTLEDVSLTQFHKLESTITGNDMLVPYLYPPGTTVTVKCISEMNYKTVGGTPQRTAVSGSARVEGAWTYFRPELTMKVISINDNTDEYGHVVGWTMTLQEV